MSDSRGDPRADPMADPMIGRTLDGRYRIDDRIGHGGMGEVYRGQHLMMERRVALKVLRPDVAEDPNAARRFAREAKSTFRLDHPNCVRVTDFGATDDGLLFLVMELLDGRTVGEELHIDGPMTSARVAHIGRQICDALHCAHEQGFVHRDLKPDNIMLIQRGGDADFVKVLDFGLAKLFDDDPDAMRTMVSITPLTQEGMVFGTPEYMSPEQAMGKSLSPATDVYSLGVLLYEMVTGRLPFEGKTFMQILSKHVKQRPTPPSQARPDLGIDPTLDELIMTCLAKRPEQRPASAAELSEAIAAAAAGSAPGQSRVPAQVAASSTVDLSAQQIQQASEAMAASAQPEPAPSAASAAATPASVPTRAGRPPPPELPPSPDPDPAAASPAQPPAVRAGPARSTGPESLAATWMAPSQPGMEAVRAGEPGAAAPVRAGDRHATGGHAPTGVIGRITGAPDSPGAVSMGRVSAATLPVSRVQQRRRRLLAVIAAVFAVGVIAVVFAVRAAGDGAARGDSAAGGERGDARPTATPQRAVDAGVSTSSADAADAAPAATVDATVDATVAAIDAGASKPAPRPRSSLDPDKRARIEQLLRAAEAARKAGNKLGQMGAADEALRIDGRNRRAQFLFGDALIKNGDKSNGCRYLRRARRLREARRAHADAGCGSGD